jgi:hypothetical protein
MHWRSALEERTLALRPSMELCSVGAREIQANWEPTLLLQAGMARQTIATLK